MIVEVDTEAQEDIATEPNGAGKQNEPREDEDDRALKLDRRNRRLKAELNELRSKLGQIEEQRAKSMPPEDLVKAKDTRIAELESALSGVHEEIKRRDRAIQERDLGDMVLGGVSEQHKSMVKEVLQARILSGKYELDQDTDLRTLAKRARKELADSYPHAFEATASAPKSSPSGPDDWSSVSSITDIPPEMYGKIPADQWNRLVQGGKGKLRI